MRTVEVKTVAIFSRKGEAYNALIKSVRMSNIIECVIFIPRGNHEPFVSNHLIVSEKFNRININRILVVNPQDGAAAV